MQDLAQYWPVGVGIVTLIAWFARLESAIKSTSIDIIDLKAKEHDLQPILKQVALDVASIKADISWLKGSNSATKMTQNN